jgi:hypothetical protein
MTMSPALELICCQVLTDNDIHCAAWLGLVSSIGPSDAVPSGSPTGCLCPNGYIWLHLRWRLKNSASTPESVHLCLVDTSKLLEQTTLQNDLMIAIVCAWIRSHFYTNGRELTLTDHDFACQKEDCLPCLQFGRDHQKQSLSKMLQSTGTTLATNQESQKTIHPKVCCRFGIGQPSKCHSHLHVYILSLQDLSLSSRRQPATSQRC